MARGLDIRPTGRGPRGCPRSVGGRGGRDDSAFEGFEALIDLAKGDFNGAEPFVESPHLGSHLPEVGADAAVQRDDDPERGDPRPDDNSDDDPDDPLGIGAHARSVARGSGRELPGWAERQVAEHATRADLAALPAPAILVGTLGTTRGCWWGCRPSKGGRMTGPDWAVIGVVLAVAVFQ